MIRLILVFLFLVIFFILSIPIILIELLVGLISKNAEKKSSLFIVNLAFKIITFLSGIKLNIKGLENVPKDEPVLYVGNHRSFFDVVVSYPLVTRSTGFVSKIEIKKVPILSWWMIILDCLFMDRKDVKQSANVIFAAIDKIKNGISICIYPEGTRNATDEDMLPFHKGSFKPAQRTNCPIVPVVITGSREVFEDHLPFIHASNITVEYLPPERFTEISKDDQKHIDEYFYNKMLQTYKKNKG